MRKLISILLAIVLISAFFPVTAVFAAESGSTTGSFSVGSVAPNVSALQVYSDSACTLVAAALTPQVLYYVKVSVSDANTLNAIKQVKLKMFYDVGATHPDESTITAGEEKTAAIFTWTKSSSTWAVDAGASPTWAVVSGSSVLPSMAASSGDWIFAIKVGKVATESLGGNVWDLHARVTDEANLTAGFNLWNKTVLWYGEVQVNTANVNFGEVALGSGFGANVNKVTGISVTYISNGNYSEQHKSSATWTGSANIATLDVNGNCVNSSEFALKCWGADIYGSAVLLNTTGAIMGQDTQTGETGDVYTTFTLWLKIATVFPVDVYSGTITYMIVNN
jgi:hypothetical protein